MSISTRPVETMSPAERRAELAELLACGLLRERDSQPRSGSSSNGQSDDPRTILPAHTPSET